MSRILGIMGDRNIKRVEFNRDTVYTQCHECMERSIGPYFEIVFDTKSPNTVVGNEANYPACFTCFKSVIDEYWEAKLKCTQVQCLP